MKSPRKVVLCVEDEDSLELRRMLFESAGFGFLGARNGDEGLKLFNQEEISAVVLDYWMPGMNGMTVATEMKRRRPEVPLIILSGFPPLPGEGVGLVDAWLQKGRVAPEKVIEQVSELIRRNTASAVEVRQDSAG
jgi:DNA-binding response OmpR family regulator